MYTIELMLLLFDDKQNIAQSCLNSMRMVKKKMFQLTTELRQLVCLCAKLFCCIHFCINITIYKAQEVNNGEHLTIKLLLVLFLYLHRS